MQCEKGIYFWKHWASTSVEAAGLNSPGLQAAGGLAGAWGAVFLAEGKTSPRAVRQKHAPYAEVRLPGWPRAECLQSGQAGYKPREVEEQTVESP